MSHGSPTFDGRAALEPQSAADPAPRSALTPRAWLVRSAPWLLALAIYAIAALAVTWPVAEDPTGTVFGAPGDATGNITLLRYRNDLGVGPLSNAVTTEENAPFGITLPGATSLPQIAIEGPMQLVGKVTGEVFAFNLAVLLGVILTAFTCFLLCWHITSNAWAAGVAGVAYGFNPWILERAAGHVHFTHLWSLCLVTLALIMIREGRGRRAWILFAAAAVFGLYTNTYFALFIGTIIVAFVIADLGAALIRRPAGAVRAAVRRGALAAGIYVAALIPQAIVSLSQRSQIDGLLAGTRSPDDSYHYGARWWEWLVPSERHPVFEDWTAPFRLARLHLSNPGETNIYLGLTVIALALVGTVTAILAWRRARGGPGWAAMFAGVLVVVGFITSLPSHVPVLGVNVPMPSAALYHVVEPWRVYARLFAVVAIGVAMLAAIGVAWLLARVPPRWPVYVGPAIAVALAVLVAFDLSARHTHFSARNTPIYDMLAEQKDDAPRVEYPLVPPTSGRHLAYIFYTRGSGHPLMNGGRPGTVQAGIQGGLTDPSRDNVAPALAALGTRWAIVHGDAYAGQPVPVPGKGFRLVGRSTTDALYEVTAAPAVAIAAPTVGFGTAEPTADGGSTQWMLGRTGELTVFNPSSRPVDVTLRFSVASFARPRNFTIRHDGRVVARGRAGDSPTDVVIPLRAAPGETVLTVRTPTKADAIAKVLGIPDARSVSLQFSDIEVSRTPRRAAAEARG